ncbi:MAG: 2-C-methyl-D-erythritol 2,4-cyclodiphosphate synthase [Bacilli bacterium]|nr:2-C-methyl-D-erythritol 2,4-cyclodiphosphate synthase [Bacilli bacterium]
MFRIGYGEDIHQLTENRELKIGGIQIPSNLGGKAHSDGDVLLHALVDALLGALALGDIGEYFSDSDPQYLNKESSFFVIETLKLIAKKGYHLVNVDSFIILENIKLKNYKKMIQENVANLLNLSIDAVSVKAGTNEKMDAAGEGKCIIAKVIVLLERDK